MNLEFGLLYGNDSGLLTITLTLTNFLEHDGLTHVIPLAVHLLSRSRGSFTESLLHFLFYY